MSRRRKPYDPNAEARRREVDAEAARLKAAGATVTRDRTGTIISAWRSNVFTILLQRGTITPNHHDAAYTLANDWAAWKGLDGKGDTFGHPVDGGSGCAELVTDRMMRAARSVSLALMAVDVQSATILRAFMVATVEEDRPMAWRGIVQRLGCDPGDITLPGGKRVDRQVHAVLTALEALRVHYQEPRRAAA